VINALKRGRSVLKQVDCQAGWASESLNWQGFPANDVALVSSHPAFDLETITKSQTYNEKLPCRTVKRAVKACLLEPVNGYELLTQEM